MTRDNERQSPDGSRDVRDELSYLLDALGDAVDEPTALQDGLTDLRGNLTRRRDGLSELLDDLGRGRGEPLDVLDDPSGGRGKTRGVPDEPDIVLVEPGIVLDEPDIVLDEPGDLLDEPGDLPDELGHVRERLSDVLVEEPSDVGAEGGGVLTRNAVFELALRDPERVAASLLVIAGGALLLVGLVPLGLLWFPFRFENAAWRFGAVSQTFDVLRVAALGAAFLTYGMVRHPNVQPRAVRLVSLVFASLAFVFVLAGLLYGTAVPSVLVEAPNQALDALRLSIIQTSTKIVVYLAACVLFARFLWRTVRTSRAPAH